MAIGTAPSLASAVKTLLQEPMRDPDWFYQRTRCPLFRKMDSELAASLIEQRVATGKWLLVPVNAGEHVCHSDPDEEMRLSFGRCGDWVCALVSGLLGVQAGAHAGRRKVTLLSQIVVPGELARHFGLAAKIGGCPHKGDELAAVYALADSWVLAIPHSEFADTSDKAESEKLLTERMILGLMGSLFDSLSTNRMIERRLAGAGSRVRFVATMLAVAARHGEVDSSDPNPDKWSVRTGFKAPPQFYKGLARLREDDKDWRKGLHLANVLEIPMSKNCRVRLWPNKLVMPELWSKFHDEIGHLSRLSSPDASAKHFRAVCRDIAYAAYRAPDRPDKERLERYGFAEDCLAQWENFLKDVLPATKNANATSGHWMM